LLFCIIGQAGQFYVVGSIKLKVKKIFFNAHSNWSLKLNISAKLTLMGAVYRSSFIFEQPGMKTNNIDGKEAEKQWQIEALAR
jgi:hypothetical protein